MDISSKKVYEILKSKGVESLHHANSVITSCQFLQCQCLLSRGTIDRNDLHQTEQMSDAIDQKYSIWFDIFLDSVDIHKQASCANLYGPVLFELDLKLIKKAYTGRVWVTKCNPTKWDISRKHEERWFKSGKDLEDNFSYGTFDHMIVFRHCGGELPFKNYLKKIILDDPKLKLKKNKVDSFSMAYGALKLAMTVGGIKVPIKKRKCSVGCSCIEDYKRKTVDPLKMFRPKI